MAGWARVAAKPQGGSVTTRIRMRSCDHLGGMNRVVCICIMSAWAARARGLRQPCKDEVASQDSGSKPCADQNLKCEVIYIKNQR